MYSLTSGALPSELVGQAERLLVALQVLPRLSSYLNQITFIPLATNSNGGEGKHILSLI